MDYEIQKAHPDWQMKRARILTLQDCKCLNCGIDPDPFTLDVHHYYYIQGRHIWEYPDTALAGLCRDCHIQWHEDNQMAKYDTQAEADYHFYQDKYWVKVG